MSDSTVVKNAIYLDLTVSPTYFFTFNYERQLYSRKNARVCSRIGLGTIASSYSLAYWNLNMPIEIDFLLGRTNHFIEGGMGITGYSFFFNSGSPNLNWFGRMGYRYQENPKGLILRIGFPPLFGRTHQTIYSYPKDTKYTWQSQFVPSGSISIGKSF